MESFNCSFSFANLSRSHLCNLPSWGTSCITDLFQPGAPKFPPKSYIVDLVHQPGSLLRKDSPDAASYQKL